MRIDIQRICVPTDFSESAERAVHYGAALAEMHGAELHLLHVVQDFASFVAHPDFTARGDAARDYFNRLEMAARARTPGESTEEPSPEDSSAPFVQTKDVSADAADAASLAAARHAEDEQAAEFLRTLEQGIDSQFGQIPRDPWWDRIHVLHATRYGNPVEEICRYARKQRIDLLVLGTHGRTGWRHVLMGSVAERVVRLGSCPVLTVRWPERGFVHEED